jgi:hypothetical protein
MTDSELIPDLSVPREEPRFVIKNTMPWYRDTDRIKHIGMTTIGIIGAVVIGVVAMRFDQVQHLFSRAFAPGTAAAEAESAVLSANTAVGCDTSASGGKYIALNATTATPCTQSPTPLPNTTASPTTMPTPAPTSGTGGGLSYQPSAPYYATFYYPWYQNPSTDGLWSDWNDPGANNVRHQPSQNWFSNYLPLPNVNPANAAPGQFDPEEGLYSSQDSNIVLWQLRKMAEANVSVAISSWWGQGHKTDAAFDKILSSVMPRPDNPYPNLRWAIYYEKQGFSNLTLNDITNDLLYIKNKYTQSPYYLKINGKPVIFVYDAAHAGGSPLTDLAIWKQARAVTGFYVNMKQDALAAGANAADMDSWHEYAPANREGQVSNTAYFVSPGFWKDGDSVRLCRNLTDSASTSCGTDHTGKTVDNFTNAVHRMVASSTTWKLIETWNEWGEGTSVEPGAQVAQSTSIPAVQDTSSSVPVFGNAYIDTLHTLLPPLSAGTGSQNNGAQPTNTPPVVIAPTVSPIPPGGANGDPVVLAAGDMSCGSTSGGAACKQMDTASLVVKTIKSSPVQAVLALGDTQYETGALADYQNYYTPSWGQFYSMTYPAVGNHEYQTSRASGFFTYFANRPVNAGKGYYDFKIGSWWIYALNSNCSQAGGCQAGSPQEVWFAKELAAHANDGACQLMFMHHPYISSDTRNFSYYNQQDQLWHDFYNVGGDIDLVGHSHFYERFGALKPIGVNGTPAAAADTARGISEFIVGTGGRNTYGFGTPAFNSLTRIGGVYGVLKLVLHPTSATWQFIASTQTTSTSDSTTGTQSVQPGQILDSGTLTCH